MHGCGLLVCLLLYLGTLVLLIKVASRVMLLHGVRAWVVWWSTRVGHRSGEIAMARFAPRPSHGRNMRWLFAVWIIFTGLEGDGEKGPGDRQLAEVTDLGENKSRGETRLGLLGRLLPAPIVDCMHSLPLTKLSLQLKLSMLPCFVISAFPLSTLRELSLRPLHWTWMGAMKSLLLRWSPAHAQRKRERERKGCQSRAAEKLSGSWSREQDCCVRRRHPFSLVPPSSVDADLAGRTEPSLRGGLHRCRLFSHGPPKKCNRAKARRGSGLQQSPALPAEPVAAMPAGYYRCGESLSLSGAPHALSLRSLPSQLAQLTRSPESFARMKRRSS